MKDAKLQNPTKRVLLDLLRAAVDGVDGYESETGHLRYWNAAQIEQARRLLDAADLQGVREQRPD